jgi:hypothetical protein
LYAKECIELPIAALNPLPISGESVWSYTVANSSAMKTAIISFSSETYLKLRRSNSLSVDIYVGEK